MQQHAPKKRACAQACLLAWAHRRACMFACNALLTCVVMCVREHRRQGAIVPHGRDRAAWKHAHSWCRMEVIMPNGSMHMPDAALKFLRRMEACTFLVQKGCGACKCMHYACTRVP
eukprot:363395-Chlamydomonas_euryale.AAC.8